MNKGHDPYTLPDDLPVPVDDGACAHLDGMPFPRLVLPSTENADVELPPSGDGATVLYCYPKTGRPGVNPPTGWDAIPGARGCTPQGCAYRDHYRELQELGAEVYGVSTQTTPDQCEFVERSHIPFPLLSDNALRLVEALRLPTFEVEGQTLIKRLTLIVTGGRITKVFYPVFPPDEDAERVVAWLQSTR